LLIRGKYESLPRRLERIRAALDDAEFAEARDERQLAKLAASWRQKANEAYLAAVQEGNAEKVRQLWEEDQYFVFLIGQADLDEIPRNAVKKALSRIVLSAARKPLAARSNWLFALLSEDKAERLDEVAQVQKDAGKEAKTTLTNRRNAWLNARGAWNQYLDRNNVGPSIAAASLPEIREHLKRGDAERALAQWEYIQREIHEYAAARLGQARAMRHLGQDPSATLEQLARDLDALLSDPALAKERAAAPTAGVFNAPAGQSRWTLLTRDWGPDGSLAWLRDSVRLAQDDKD
jgi:hypothetical protein